MKDFDYSAGVVFAVGLILGLIAGFFLGASYIVDMMQETIEPLIEKVNMNVTVDLDEEALVNYTYKLIQMEQNEAG